MKKLKSIHIKFILITTLLIWTIASLLIVLKNIVGDTTIKIVIGNVILLVITYLYLLVDSILKLIKLERDRIKDRVFKFIIFFILIMSIDLIFYFFTKAKDLNLRSGILMSLILSLGISLFDLSFKNKIKERR